jgi:hypothetical protein
VYEQPFGKITKNELKEYANKQTDESAKKELTALTEKYDDLRNESFELMTTKFWGFRLNVLNAAEVTQSDVESYFAKGLSKEDLALFNQLKKDNITGKQLLLVMALALDDEKLFLELSKECSLPKLSDKYFNSESTKEVKFFGLDGFWWVDVRKEYQFSKFFQRNATLAYGKEKFEGQDEYKLEDYRKLITYATLKEPQENLIKAILTHAIHKDDVDLLKRTLQQSSENNKLLDQECLIQAIKGSSYEVLKLVLENGSFDTPALNEAIKAEWTHSTRELVRSHSITFLGKEIPHSGELREYNNSKLQHTLPSLTF